MWGNAISMIEIASACSRPSTESSLPSGANMVSISSMFMSIAPIRILRAKIASFGGGTPSALISWASARPAVARKTNATQSRADRAGNRRPSLKAGLLLRTQIGREGLAGRRQRDPLQGAAMFVGVAQRAHLDHHLVAGLDRVARPSAGPHQVARAGHLQQPFGGLFTVRDGALHQQGDVRVGPAQLEDHALEGERPGMIEHRGGVVRRGHGYPGRNAERRAGERLTENLHAISPDLRSIFG